jgi:RimJ/RimL family protein N-acetyltransferase
MLYTTRLYIRELELSDTESIHHLHSLPETDKFNTLGIPETIQTTEALLQKWIKERKQLPRSSYIFCIEIVDTKQFIGLIALNLGDEKFKMGEVWYKLDVKFWRKGYTTEALTRLLDFAFNTLQLHRIEAGCAVEHIASIRVLEKVGMIREGRKRKKLPIRGEWLDNYFYAILEEDFNKNQIFLCATNAGKRSK